MLLLPIVQRSPLSGQPQDTFNCIHLQKRNFVYFTPLTRLAKKGFCELCSVFGVESKGKEAVVIEVIEHTTLGAAPDWSITLYFLGRTHPKRFPEPSSQLEPELLDLFHAHVASLALTIRREL